MSAPEFFYDFNSPYAYLASLRVDDVLPVAPVWQPIAFGVIVRHTNKVPWSFVEPEDGQREIARRARERGLPTVVYPDGWPRECYSLAPLRAALVAEDAGRQREFARELYRNVFELGLPPGDIEAVVAAAERAGVDAQDVRDGVADPELKARLHEATDDALARGINGVPTVAVGDQLFWGDDRLEDAAAAC